MASLTWHWWSATVHSFPDAAHLVLDDAGDRVIPLIVNHLGAVP